MTERGKKRESVRSRRPQHCPDKGRRKDELSGAIAYQKVVNEGKRS